MASFASHTDDLAFESLIWASTDPESHVVSSIPRRLAELLCNSTSHSSFENLLSNGMISVCASAVQTKLLVAEEEVSINPTVIPDTADNSTNSSLVSQATVETHYNSFWTDIYVELHDNLDLHLDEFKMTVKYFSKWECHISRCLLNFHKSTNAVPIALKLAGKLDRLTSLSSNTKLINTVAQNVFDLIDKDLHTEQSLLSHVDLFRSMTNMYDYIRIDSVVDSGVALMAKHGLARNQSVGVMRMKQGQAVLANYKGKFVIALDLFLKCIEDVRSVTFLSDREKDIEMFDALTSMADICDTMRDKEKTELYAAMSKEIGDRIFGEDHPNCRFLLITLENQVLRDKQRILENIPDTAPHKKEDYLESKDEAELDFSDRPTAIVLEAYGFRHMISFIRLMTLVEDSLRLREYRRCRRILDMCLEMQADVIKEENSPDLARLYHCDASWHYALGSLAECRDIAQKALDVCRSYFYPDNAMTWSCIGLVAVACRDLGLKEEYAALVTDNLSLCERIYGKDHSEYAATLIAQSMIADDKGIFEDSEKYRKQALDVFKALYGENSDEVAQCYLLLAYSHTSLSKPDLALEEATKAAEYYKKSITNSLQPGITYGRCIFSIAGSLETLFRFEEAVTHYSQSLAIQLLYVAADDINLVQTYVQYSHCIITVGTPLLEAERMLDTALKILKDKDEDPYKDVNMIGALNDLAFCREARGLNDEGKELRHKVIDMQRTLVGENNAGMVQLLTNLAECLIRTKGDEEEIVALRKSIVEVHLKLNPDIAGPEVGNARIVYANAMQDAGKIQEALDMCMQYMSELRDEDKVDSTIFPSVICIISRFMEEKGDVENAKTFYEDNVKLVQDQCGATSVPGIWMLSFHGQYEVTRNRLDSAQDMFERSLSYIAEGLALVDSTDEVTVTDYIIAKASTLFHLANLQEEKGELAKAEATMRQAADVQAISKGPDSDLHKIDANFRLAVILRRQGKHEDARVILLELIQEAYVAKVVQNSIASYEWELAETYFSIGDFTLSLVRAEKTISILRGVYSDPMDPAFVRLYAVTGEILTALGRHDEAVVYVKKCFEIQKKQNLGCHPDFLSTFRALAINSFSRKQFSECRAYIEDALATIEGVEHGADNPFTASFLRDMAQVDYVQEQVGDAERNLCEAIRMFKQTLGSTHTDVLSTMQQLAQLYEATGDDEKYDVLLVDIQELMEEADREAMPTSM